MAWDASRAIKLMVPYRNGIVVCTADNELWYGEPGYSVAAGWTWCRI